MSGPIKHIPLPGVVTPHGLDYQCSECLAFLNREAMKPHGKTILCHECYDRLVPLEVKNRALTKFLSKMAHSKSPTTTDVSEEFIRHYGSVQELGAALAEHLKLMLATKPTESCTTRAFSAVLKMIENSTQHRMAIEEDAISDEDVERRMVEIISLAVLPPEPLQIGFAEDSIEERKSG